jgi:type IV pilus assembly protein PilA
MLRKLRDDESGFTLIELLVVILIIGILAAIALPTFLGQQKKGQDASAKSNARNAVSQVESCYVDEQAYANCDASTDTAMADAKIDWSKVAVTTSGLAAGEAYKVDATSDSNNHFFITKKTDGTYSRSCTTSGTGSCKSDGKW